MNVYNFLAESDRRTKLYKQMDAELDRIVSKYGKESKEVEDFFNSELTKPND